MERGDLLSSVLNAASYFVDRHLSEGRGERTAILAENQELNYRDVASSVNRAGNALRELGVEMENRVAILLPDSPEFVYAFFGAIKIGAVAVPLRPSLQPEEVAHLLTDSRAKVLVVSAQSLPRLDPVLGDLPHLHAVLVVGDAGDHLSFDVMTERQPPTLAAAPTHRDDATFWMYTSGTTGASRAAVHLQHDMPWFTERLARPVLGLGEGDRVLSVAPLAIAYGLGVALHCSLAVGATVVLAQSSRKPVDLLATLDRFRPTVLAANPSTYAALALLAQDDPAVRFPALRVGISGGDVLPAWIYHAWLERFGVEILDGIGSTELSTMPIHNRIGAARPGSCGTLVPGHEVKIVDDHGREVAAGEVGTLVVKADSTCAYYWHNQVESSRKIRGEWFYTGDRMRMDEDGYFWYEGRSDDLLRINGTWMSPLEVERVVAQHPEVAECAYVSVRGPAGLSRPLTFVVLRDGSKPGDFMTWKIQRFVWQKIPPGTFPLSITYVDSLPKTASGKVQRYKLRAGASREFPQAVSPT